MLSAYYERQNELAAKRRENNLQARQNHLLRDVKSSPRRRQPRLFDDTFEPPAQPEARKPPTFPGVSAAGTSEQLELSLQLNARFDQLQDDLGFRSWYALLRHVDAADTGLLNFGSFSKLIRHQLALPPATLPESQLRSLWVALDHPCTGTVSWPHFGRFARLGEAGPARVKEAKERKEATAREAAKRLRAERNARLHRHILEELSGAPAADAVTVTDLSRRFNKQMSIIGKIKPMSWVKLYQHMDKDNSGLISYAEFSEMVRHELELPHQCLSEKNLKMVWLALDSDESGNVSLAEFAAFMRLGAAKDKARRNSERRKEIAHNARASVEEVKLAHARKETIEAAERAKALQEEAKLVEAQLAALGARSRMTV